MRDHPYPKKRREAAPFERAAEKTLDLSRPNNYEENVPNYVRDSYRSGLAFGTGDTEGGPKNIVFI